MDILHDPKYLVLQKYWDYSTLGSCRVFSINSIIEISQNRALWGQRFRVRDFLQVAPFRVRDLLLVTLSTWYSLGLRILCSWRMSLRSHPGNLVSNPWNLADLLRLYIVKVIQRLYWGYIGIMEKKMETTIISYKGSTAISANRAPQITRKRSFVIPLWTPFKGGFWVRYTQD